MFKELFLRGKIIFKCAVIVQVVARDICEHRRVEVYALESPLRERLRRSLHDAGFTPLGNGAREQRIKLGRLRRSQPARQIFIPEAVADCSGEQCFRPRIGKDISDKRGHRRFAVCAGDAYQSEPALRVITECRAKARICAAGIRDTKLVFESQPILSHNSRRARGERIQSRRVTVEAPVAYAHKQRAGSDESAVIGDEIYIRIVFYTSVKFNFPEQFGKSH